MKNLKKIIIMLGLILSVAGCEAAEKPVIKNEATVVTPANEEESSEVPTESSIALSPITFGEANDEANKGYSEDFLRIYQYQVGKMNYIPLEFNGKILSEDTYEEFLALIKSSPYFEGIYETEQDGVNYTEINFNNGDFFKFRNGTLYSAAVNCNYNDLFPVEYAVCDIPLGATINQINNNTGTNFTDYPELRSLTIRDENTDSFIQVAIYEGEAKEITFYLSE